MKAAFPQSWGRFLKEKKERRMIGSNGSLKGFRIQVRFWRLTLTECRTGWEIGGEQGKYNGRRIPKPARGNYNDVQCSATWRGFVLFFFLPFQCSLILTRRVTKSYAQKKLESCNSVLCSAHEILFLCQHYCNVGAFVLGTLFLSLVRDVENVKNF